MNFDWIRSKRKTRTNRSWSTYKFDIWNMLCAMLNYKQRFSRLDKQFFDIVDIFLHYHHPIAAFCSKMNLKRRRRYLLCLSTLVKVKMEILLINRETERRAKRRRYLLLSIASNREKRQMSMEKKICRYFSSFSPLLHSEISRRSAKRKELTIERVCVVCHHLCIDGKDQSSISSNKKQKSRSSDEMINSDKWPLSFDWFCRSDWQMEELRSNYSSILFQQQFRLQQSSYCVGENTFAIAKTKTNLADF